MNYANQLGTNSTITFSPNLFASGAATLGLTNILYFDNVTGKTTVAGPGAKLLTIVGHFQMDTGGGEFDGITFAYDATGGDGGVMRSYGTLAYNACTFSNNYANTFGGAIYNGGVGAVTNCTFVGNQAGISGGAIGNEGILTVVNSTFDGNTANQTGGAIMNIYSSSRTYLYNSTLTGNAANNAGGALDNYGTLLIYNSIVSGNTAPTGTNIHGNVLDSENCLIDSAATNIFATGQLANNGGPTETIALNPFGPAINAGNNALIPAGITTDQRGLPRINDGTVDIGAVRISVRAAGHHQRRQRGFPDQPLEQFQLHRHRALRPPASRCREPCPRGDFQLGHFERHTAGWGGRNLSFDRHGHKWRRARRRAEFQVDRRGAKCVCRASEF